MTLSGTTLEALHRLGTITRGKKTATLHFMSYQSFNKEPKLTVRFRKCLKAKEYVSKSVKTHVKCVETGCVAGICGIAVTPDLYYWDCPRHQEIMGRYPQPIRDVLRRPEDIMNPFDTSCKYMGW